MLSLLKHNPFRTPEWRFSRVLSLLAPRAENSKKVRASWKYDDDYIKKFKQFFSRLNKSDEPGGSWQQLFNENPGMYYAWLLHDSSDDELRCNVQARLLARQTDEQIADEISTLPSTIEWYAAMFFDVRSRLKSRDWVVKAIMGPASMRGIENRDFDIAAKLFGYFGGPLVLDTILHAFNGTDLVDDRAQVEGYLDRQMSVGVRRKSAMAALNFEVNRYNVIELFGIHARLIELERSYETGGGVQSDYEQMIMKMTSNLPFSVGSDARDRLASSPLAAYQGLPGELRTSDMLLVAAGQAPPDLLERTRNKRLPPPRKVTHEINLAGDGTPPAAGGEASDHGGG